MTEIDKIKTSHAPPIMHHLFQFRENTLIKKFNLNLRNFRQLLTHDKKTSNYGYKNAKYEYKNPTSLSDFKTKIKYWKDCEICPCMLRKDYQPDIGYI